MKRVLLVLAVIIGLNACIKQDCIRSFEFHFPATITQGDTFAIGDTIWMEMSLPNALLDHQTGELIDLSEFDLYLGLGISKLDTLYVTTGMYDFELVERVGSFSQSGGGRFISTYVHFKDIKDKRFQVGVIPKKKGVYGMALSLPLEYGIAEESLDSDDWLQIIHSSCYQRIMEYSGTRFADGCPNYYLMRNYPCQQTSVSDTLMMCLGDSTFMAQGGGHAFVVD
ncbi:MAG: hypothetical protein AB8E82_12245 [Aureispira sp.]